MTRATSHLAELLHILRTVPPVPKTEQAAATAPGLHSPIPAPGAASSSPWTGEHMSTLQPEQQEAAQS